MSNYLLTYLLLTYLHTYIARVIIFHVDSNPGTNPWIQEFVFHNPEIPGLEKWSGIASPIRQGSLGWVGGSGQHAFPTGSAVSDKFEPFLRL